ncbi:MAG TPA: FHA domain-containing protein [Polyangiales bacterium]|nr:FHA domain-containing protein [Polyangiales bacterium]
MNELYFAEYLREFRAKGKISLESALIVRHGDGEDGDGEIFSTVHGGEPPPQNGSEPSGQWRPSLTDREQDSKHLGLVFPLVKRPGNAFDYISVGRTSNVDVTLPLQQISKFHAYFSKTPTGEYTIADGGSKNGTRVGTRKLEVRTPVPVRSGERIALGPYLFTFYTPDKFAELVIAKAIRS